VNRAWIVCAALAVGAHALLLFRHPPGHAGAVTAALRAVRRWTFEPARTAGIPTASKVEIPVRFDLRR